MNSGEIIAIIEKIILILGIGVFTFIFSHLVNKFIKRHSSKIESTLPVTSLTQNIARVIIFILGILLILNNLGISITPILATLGVGGLAVALALQDTLSNFFAGFHIIANRQIKIGDYIKLESGQEGFVTDITWRLTKIRSADNNIVLVPNTKLTQFIITNYYQPDKGVYIALNLRVHYNSDLEKVERVAVEAAKEVLKNIYSGLYPLEAVAQFSGLAESSINLNVSFKARDFMDQYKIKHELIKRLLVRFKDEGIIIPYPIQEINYRQEKEG